MTLIFDRSSKALARMSPEALDLFWLVHPNCQDAPRNPYSSSLILRYIAVPIALANLRRAAFCTQFKASPLVQTNDPRLTRIPEPGHVLA